MSISLGVRHAFGLFLAPMSADLGWGRATFALAIALQNLVWGLAQPFAGRLADRYGAGKLSRCVPLYADPRQWRMNLDPAVARTIIAQPIDPPCNSKKVLITN